jgi:hypothetical protein
MSARRQKHTKFVDELTTGHVPLDESVTPLVELTSDATAAQTASTSTSTTSSSSSSSSSSTSTASVVKVGAPKSTKQAASSSSDDDGSGNNDETNLTTSEATALLSSTDQSAGRIIRKSDSAGTSRGGDVPIVGRGFANIDRADSGTMSVASGAGSYQEIVDTKRTLVKDDSEQDANEKSDDAGKAKTDSGSSRFLHTAETTPPIDRRVIAAESPLRKTSIGTGVTDVSSAAGVDAVIVMTTTTVTATTSVVSAPASSSVSTAASPSTGEHRRRSREAGKRKAGAKSPSKPRRASAVASSDVAGEFVTDTKSTKRTSSGERHRKKHVAGGGDGTRKHHSAPARAEGVTATTASVSSTPAADIDDDDARSLLRALDSRRLAPILKSPGRVSVRASTRKYSVRWPDARTVSAVMLLRVSESEC